MSKLEELEKAISLLKGQDIDALKHALMLIGEPIASAEQAPLVGGFFEIGKCYFIRTVTLYQVGRVVAISGQFLKLEDASWIADTGRFSAALKSGEFSEIEPVGESYINISSIIDSFPWPHKLPESVK